MDISESGVSRLRDDISVLQLREQLSDTEATMIDDYQRSHTTLDNPRELIFKPLPDEFTLARKDMARILINNITKYDDEVSAAFHQDPVIKVIQAAKRRGHNAVGVAQATRARRSIIARSVGSIVVSEKEKVVS